MTKKTILDMTQDILSDMNSDEVSSITDTLESMQVAQIIKSTYEDLMSRKNWDHLRKLTQLDASGTTARPTHMRVEEAIKEVVSLNYNKQTSTQTSSKWQPVTYMLPDDFLRHINGRNADQASTDEIEDVTGVKLLIKNNTAPSYYTSFDDDYIVFDSYDNTVDSTLQASKVQMLAYVQPTFTLSDAFIPDLPAEMFSVLLADAKSTCFTRIKQMPEGKAEQQSRKGMSWASQRAFQVAGGWNFPNYGRRSKK